MTYINRHIGLEKSYIYVYVYIYRYTYMYDMCIYRERDILYIYVYIHIFDKTIILYWKTNNMDPPGTQLILSGEQ